MLLSVIIPVYNLEKYIEECVHSVCSQTYKQLEIIIVDDGSSDGSLDICQRLAGEDERIIVVTQKNAGVTMARKKGLSLATGEYVAFVDGDDYLEPDMYSHMMQNIAGYDLVASGYFYHLSDGCVEKRFDDFEGVYQTKKEMQQIWDKMIYNLEINKINSIIPALWNKVYKKELAQNIMEKVDANIFYGEDAVFLFQYLLECKSVFFYKEAFYHYRFRKESVCRSTNERMLENTSAMYLSLKAVFEDHDMKASLMEQLKKRTVDATLEAINRYMGVSLRYRVPKFIIDIEDLRGCRFVLYGASQMGQDVKAICLKEKIETVAWLDKNYQYFQELGLEVDSPCILDDLEFDKLLIAVSKESLAEAIKKELLEKGIREDVIVWKKPLVLY